MMRGDQGLSMTDNAQITGMPWLFLWVWLKFRRVKEASGSRLSSQHKFCYVIIIMLQLQKYGVNFSKDQNTSSCLKNRHIRLDWHALKVVWSGGLTAAIPDASRSYHVSTPECQSSNSSLKDFIELDKIQFEKTSSIPVWQIISSGKISVANG